MAVKIRLTRCGRTKKPVYRIIAANVDGKRDGRFLEVIGTYDPLQNPLQLKINDQLLDKWLGQGAQPTQTVRSLIKRHRASVPVTTE